MSKTTNRLLIISIPVLLSILFITMQAFSQSVEWSVAPGGGGEASAGGANFLSGTISQTVTGNTINVNTDIQGYRQSIPRPPSVACEINSAACVPTTACYGPSAGPFTFSNTCGGSVCAFQEGATQFYKYIFQTSNVYANATLQGGTTWGVSADGWCPTGSCTENGTSFTITPGSTGSWYMIVRSFNGGRTDRGLIGGDLVLGPYTYDKTAPVVAFSSPAASSWWNVNIPVNTTDSDANCGSSSVTCEYSVVSNGVPTLGWTARTCNASPSMTVAINASACVDQGLDKCQINLRATDAVGNVTTTVSRTFSPDWTAPNNPTVAGYDAAAKTVTLTSGQTYAYTQPTGPYFEWTAPSDLPAPSNSGVRRYYVSFTTNSSDDPATSQLGLSYTNSTALVVGSTYYLRIKTEDNAGNISSPTTAFIYNYSGGGYLAVTEKDAAATSYGGLLGSDDDIDGILAPDNSDNEIVLIQLYDEWNALATNPPMSTKQVTVSLSNVGTTGAFIDTTNMTGVVQGSCALADYTANICKTGNLVGGWAWIKLKANSAAAEQATAVVVTATATGLSGQGGRDQKAYILVRKDSYAAVPVGTVEYGKASPTAGDTVMNPVWSHAGEDIVVAMREAAGDKWNLYKLHWTGAAWAAPLRLTNNTMNVQPDAKYSFTDSAIFLLQDKYVIFSAYNGSPEAYAVAADGSDKDLSLADLAAANKKVSNGTNGYQWWDTAWSSASCVNGYANKLLVSFGDGPAGNGVEIYMMDSILNILGIYTELLSTFTTVTQIGGGDTWTLQPSWSKDCSKIVFTVWDGWTTPARTGIYIANLTDGAYGPTVTLPITSLAQAGVTKIHDCTAASCAVGSALYPTFTEDGNMVSYMADPDNSFDMMTLIMSSFNGTSLASSFFSGENFDNYLEYINDQPTFTPQLLGQSANNEFGLVQCFGASCPMTGAGGNIFAYITQKTGGSDGKLSFLDLSSPNVIATTGGLLFYQGSVTAVIPPGALDSDMVLTVDTAAPTLAPASQDDILVTTGEAREFYPDGVIFNKDIRMIFRYCDTDSDGYLDVRQDATCAGATGGNTTIQETKLYAYYYCKNVSGTLGCTANTWVKLDGSIDTVNNSITVAINHFSKYDILALARGLLAPAAPVNTHFDDIHTFPNPWRSINGPITFFAAGTSQYNTGGAITVDVQVYDMRGKIVRNIHRVHSGTIATSGTGFELATWDAKNNSGRQVASSVYPYVIHIFDGVFGKTYTGKLAVVR